MQAREILTQLSIDRESRISRLPADIRREIGFFCQGYSDIAKALHHAAYARKEDVDALMTMLEVNPLLLLEKGNVVTPGGHDVRNVTIYEFLLGAGDPDLAEKAGNYFAKIGHGEEAERMRQYERYKPHIEAMLTQTPYDLTPLIDIIKQSTAADVTAALNKDMTHESVLRNALIQFRNDHAPRVIDHPCMHYNYRSLQHALEMLDREWGNLYRASGDNWDKILIVWRLLIGFEMRRLPGVDRCATAQGLQYVIDQKQPLARSYKFTHDTGDFPLSLNDDLGVGLGGNFAVDIYYGVGGGRLAQRAIGGGRFLENLCRAKAQALQNLCCHALKRGQPDVSFADMKLA